MTLRKRFLSGIYWNLIEHIILFGLGFIISILITRGLGPYNYGIYSSVVALTATCGIFFAFGFEDILNVYLPKLFHLPDGGKKVNLILKRLISIRFALFFAIGLIMFIFAKSIAAFIKHPEIYAYLRLASVYMVLSGMVTILRMAFRSGLHNKIVTMAEAFGQAAFLLSIVLFFQFGYGVFGVISSLIFSTGVSLLIYLLFLRKKYTFLGAYEGIVSFRQFYKLGLTFWLGNLFLFVLGKNIDIIFLTYFKVPAEQVGFYSLSFTLLAMLYIFCQGLGAIAQSIFSETYSKEGRQGLEKSFRIIYKLNSLLMLPNFIFAFFYIKPIITIFYSAKYIDAVKIFQAFILFRLVSSVVVSSGYSICVFYTLEKKRAILLFNIVSGLLNVILDIMLIPLFGVMGAVIATGFSAALAGILQINFVIKQIKYSIPWLFLFKLTLACCLALAFTFLVPGTGLLSLLTKLVVFGTGLAVFIIAIKLLDKEEKNMLRGIHPLLDKMFDYINFFELEPSV